MSVEQVSLLLGLLSFMAGAGFLAILGLVSLHLRPVGTKPPVADDHATNDLTTLELTS